MYSIKQTNQYIIKTKEVEKLEHKIADLTEKQKEQIQKMENELGFVLVAYDAKNNFK